MAQLNYDERLKWIEKLDEAYSKFKMGKFEKFFKYPLWTAKMSIISRFLHNILKDRLSIHSRVRLFFGEDMYITFPPYYDVKFYGAYVVSDAEVRMTKYLIKTLKKGDIFFDIGANQGYYSILASALVGNFGKVYSFEPDPRNISVLMKNKRENVVVIEKAVNDSSGKLDFYSVVGISGVSSFDVKYISEYRYRKIQVEAITLDFFCSSEKIVPNYIKIDVEGAEEKVLVGASELLTENSPIILLEVWFKPFTENYKRSIDILNTYGYKMFAIDDEGEIDEIKNLIGYFDYLDSKYRQLPFTEGILFDNIVFVKV
jgi:FkbM family methyltransferase